MEPKPLALQIAFHLHHPPTVAVVCYPGGPMIHSFMEAPPPPSPYISATSPLPQATIGPIVATSLLHLLHLPAHPMSRAPASPSLLHPQHFCMQLELNPFTCFISLSPPPPTLKLPPPSHPDTQTPFSYPNIF